VDVVIGPVEVIEWLPYGAVVG